MRDVPLPARIDDVEFAKVVDYAVHGEVDASGIARLATHLAESGERLAWPPERPVSDLASTGGPASLSTLIPPFILNSAGCNVVKLGVSGRPAGAIDTLGTIPGYRVHLNSDDVRATLRRCGFAHFLADERFAPMDAALFAYRRRVGAVAVPFLAASSLLAKKVAVGVVKVGLDVRVSAHGNFGTTIEDARRNARAFCVAATSLGIEAVAFISRADQPMQPWIGRGESLVALAVAAGLLPARSSVWLDDHLEQCHSMAEAVIGNGGGNYRNGLPYERSLRSARTDIRGVLEAHLISQGAGIHALLARVSAVLEAPRGQVVSRDRGILSIDLGVIRDVLVRAQADAPRGAFNDPAGLELLVRPGREVLPDQELAVVRCTSSESVQRMISEVRPAFRVASNVEHRSHDESRVEVVRG